MIEIYLNPPIIQGNKVFFSWHPNYLFNEPGYFTEYLDLKEIVASPESLAEAYLPVCLTFTTLGKVTIHLPSNIPAETLDAWYTLLTDTARVLFRRPFQARIVNPEGNAERKPVEHCNNTVLLFGGGSESLLALSYLLDKNISPYLVSMWGSNWPGSDLEVNQYRYKLEEEISKEFKLKVFRIFTNFREILEVKEMHPYLKRNCHFINAVLFLPINLSLVFPIARQLSLKQIISGNERESSYDLGYYSLSSEMTRNLRHCSSHAEYHSHLEDLSKVQIVKTLQLKYPELGKYQSSCWRVKGERWCLKCEKCLRNYLIYKIYGIDPACVEMNEERIKENLKELVWKVGWEIVSNRAVRREWSCMRQQAAHEKNQEVLNVMTQIHSKFFLRKSYTVLKRLLVV